METNSQMITPQGNSNVNQSTNAHSGIPLIKISLFNANENEPHKAEYASEVVTLDWHALSKQINLKSWSPATFAESKRLIRNFIEMRIFVGDVDSGATLEQAMKDFAPYKHIIATTKSHQKLKRNKPPCDRFRVILLLDGFLTSDEDFKATFDYALSKFPYLDVSCKDSARFFFACRDLVSIKEDGECFPCQKAVPKQSALKSPNPPKPKNKPNRTSVAPPYNQKGSLSRQTYDFLAFGADDGEWHSRLFKATIDLKEQEYSKEAATELLEKATAGYLGYLDAEDLHTINDVYENREVRYPPRTNSISSEKVQSPPPMPKSMDLIPSIEEREAIIEDEHRQLMEAMKNAHTFIDPCFDPYFKLTNGFTIIGGETGKGKSTVVANICYQFLADKHPNKKILIISNEENTNGVLSRVACLTLNLPWNLYSTNALRPEESAEVLRVSKILNKVITVVANKMDTLENVTAAINYALETEEYALVLLDYLQTVYRSEENPSMRPWEVSKALGQFIRTSCRSIQKPLIAMVQLKPEGDDLENFGDRICYDRTMLQHVSCAIEIQRNASLDKTTFTCRKMRVPSTRQFKKITMVFDKGRFRPDTSETLLDTRLNSPQHHPKGNPIQKPVPPNDEPRS